MNEIIGDIGEEIEIDVDVEVDHDNACVAVAETETGRVFSVANILFTAVVLVFAGAMGGTSYAIVRAVRRSKSHAVGGVDELNLVDSHSPTFVPSYSPTYAPSTVRPVNASSSLYRHFDDASNFLMCFFFN